MENFGGTESKARNLPPNQEIAVKGEHKPTYMYRYLECDIIYRQHTYPIYVTLVTKSSPLCL